MCFTRVWPFFLLLRNSAFLLQRLKVSRLIALLTLSPLSGTSLPQRSHEYPFFTRFSIVFAPHPGETTCVSSCAFDLLTVVLYTCGPLSLVRFSLYFNAIKGRSSLPQVMQDVPFLAFSTRTAIRLKPSSQAGTAPGNPYFTPSERMRKW